MTEHRQIEPLGRRRAAFAAGGFALVLFAAGCAGGSETPPPPAPSESQAPATTATTDGGEVPGGVTEAQAQQLCTDMEKQLQSWRTYTPTIGKAGLNTLVGSWIAQNGLDPIAFVRDKARIDTITSSACPEVRDGAISALDIPDLASGLIGL
ncbi:hypothetical protein [Rhodococcus sp. NPDC058521]|uniref:hypothetical protein n=1 Tax=Rhodococcus sp. NPDC058521 TaxID=3346536 RepID=UPI0036500AEA